MDEEDTGLSLSIGAVSRATGVPSNTLRTWERRYGFPKPLRTEGGQRAYSAAIVPHLVEIARALDRGLRPREALTASREELSKWASPDLAPEPSERSALIEAVRHMDAVSLRRAMSVAWAERGGVACMDEVIAPLLRDIGQLWVDGRMEVYQEHFASEVMRSFLTHNWRPLADSASGPLVVCACLPGESHDLGLHFAATTLALSGRRIRYLGLNTPLPDLLAACNSGNVEVVAISVSAYADPAVMESSIKELRALLPDGIGMLLGGAGAPRIDGTVRLTSCASLYAWARPGA